MLLELKVSNFAIIDNVSVEFKPGFNVLSGETGSGKSILLKSLALLMGEKSTSDTIQNGANNATVEGAFDISHRKDIRERLHNAGIESEDDTLLVKRWISIDGKNRVYINGSLSTLQQLKDIVSPLIEVTGHQAPLIEMTGQHENRHLHSRTYHLEALDQYIGALPLRAEVETHFHEFIRLKEELRELLESSRNKNQRLDFLIYQRDEIAALNLKPGDEELLEQNLHTVKNSARLNEFIDSAESALYSDDDSALVRIHRVLQKSIEFSGGSREGVSLLDGALKNQFENLSQAKTLIEECVYGLRDYSKRIQSSDTQIEDVEEKLSQLRKLQKKHGASVVEILDTLAKIELEIGSLEKIEDSCLELQNKISDTEKILSAKSLKLHKARLGGAETLSKSVNAELDDLNMKGLIFSVNVEKIEDASKTSSAANTLNTEKITLGDANVAPNKFTATGISQVEFLIQSSKADSKRSLSKFASGGELSRILLALKRVVGYSEYPRTYLFDEVDAGVSGVTAEKVGRKLKSIAKGQQVISVTHLPQVAAFAHAHYVISKSSRADGKVQMTVQELDKKDQVREIARMLSGEKITKTSLDHAKELLSV